MIFSDKIHHNHAGTRSSLPASPPTIYTIIVMVVLNYIYSIYSITIIVYIVRGHVKVLGVGGGICTVKNRHVL